jgi:pyridoxal phosphate enzyme (YggS family)
MVSIPSALQAVRERMTRACVDANRDPSTVHLLAVSKTQPAERVALAYEAGQTAFGENFVQEGLDKIDRLAALAIEWHFIGTIQANKTRQIAEKFHWVHGVDRLKIAERLSAQRPAQLAPLQVCIQVNVSGEDSKSGVDPAATPSLAKAIAALPRLRLRGLMAIPEPVPDFPAQRTAFRVLANLQGQLLRAGLALDTLSMGMSADLEAAIAEGATIVRVGTAIFGSRHRGL